MSDPQTQSSPEPLDGSPSVEETPHPDPVVQLYLEGLPFKEITRRTGVCATTISNKARAAGLRRNRCYQSNPLDTDRAYDLYDLGYSLREVAEQVGTGYERIRRAFHHEGRTLRPGIGSPRGKTLLTRLHLERWISMIGLGEEDEVMEQMCLLLEGKLR